MVHGFMAKEQVRGLVVIDRNSEPHKCSVCEATSKPMSCWFSPGNCSYGSALRATPKQGGEMRDLVAIVEIEDPVGETEGDGYSYVPIEDLQSWILSTLVSRMEPRWKVRKVEVREVETT